MKERNNDPNLDNLIQNIGEMMNSVNQLAKQAHTQYALEVDTILKTQCNDTQHIQHLLDGSFDFCFDEEVLRLFKRLCHYYYAIDPEATASYVNAYREMWDKEEGGREF